MADPIQHDPWSFQTAMTDLSSALKPSREQLTAIADLPWGELEKAREQMRSAGTLTPDVDTFMSAVEREHVNDLTSRWSDPAVDENVVIQEAEQMFRGGTLPIRFEPLVNAIVREKMKDANSRGTGESALRIAKGFVQNAVPVATEMAKSVGENIYTATGEVPASLAAMALGKLQGAEGVPSGTKEGAITPSSIAAGKALEQEGFETGMRAGARVVSGMEAETRDSARSLKYGLPRLYDLVTAAAKSGGIGFGNPLFAANAAMAMAGLGEAVQTQELRKRALTDDKALADFVKLRRAEEAKILDAREFKGEWAKAIGADLESLKAQGVELKPEDPERARIGGVMLDITEPPLVPFMMGASITGKGMRRLTAASLKGLGAEKLAKVVGGTVAKATPSTIVLNRAVRTAKQVAEDAAEYDTVFRKIRVATGNKLVDVGQRIQNIPLPVGAPLLVGGGVLAAGGDAHTAGVAALTTAAGRYFLGTRYGVRAAGRATEMAGKALRYTPAPTSPWEAVRRGAIDLRRDMTLAAAAGIAESSLYALDPSLSPEAKGAILSSGAIMAPAGAAGARFKDWAQHGLLFSARLGRPDSLSGAPAKPRVYGTESDAITQSSFDKLSEDSTIFLRSLQDLLGDNGLLHIATSPEEFQKLYAQRTKQEPGVPPRLIRSGQQGHALSGKVTVSGKPEAILNLSNSANESAGHEVTHTLLYVLEASGPEGAAKVKQLREQAAKSLGGVGSNNFNAVKAGYEAAFGDVVTDAYAIDEWLAEHGSVVLAGLPLGKLGAEKGLVEGIYDALFMLAEDLQLRVPGYLQEAGGPITSEALRYTPSVSLLNAMDNVFHAYKLENDALVPSAAPAPTPGTSTAQPGRAAAAPEEAVIPPVKTAPAFEAGTGVLSPIPAELAVDPQAPLKPEGVTGEADISPAAKEMLQDINDGGRPSQAKLDKIAAEVGLPAGSTLTEVVAALQAKRIRAGAVLPVTPAAPAPAPTPEPAATPAPRPQPPGGIYTEDQTRRVLAGGEATPEVLAENQRIIDEELSKPQGERQPHQADYNSAKVDEADKSNPLGLTEPQRLEQRRLADAGEQAGVADGLRALYDKVMVFIRSTNEGKNVYSFNLDKVIRNIDMLGQWFAENPKAGTQILAQAGYTSFSDPKFIKDFQSYLANQSNGYRGDGRPIVRPEGTDATLVPPENRNYTPVPVPEEGAKLINSLMGVRNITDWGAGAPLEKVFAIRLAEANGAPLVEQTGGGVSPKGRMLRPKAEFNTTNKALRDAGFDTGLFHVAIENLRVSRMGTPLRPRPDLANIKAPATAFIQAGFMPEAAKEPMSVLRGRAQSLRHGAVITDYVKALVAADNATFMKELDATQTSLLADIANHYQLPVDPSKGGRLGVLSAVRKELAFQRKRAAKPAAPQLVNVGLKIGDKVALTEQDVIKAFADEGLTLTNVELRESGTEPTVIAAVRNADKAKVYRIAEKLGQDAIALYNPVSDAGILVGPRPENFGGKFLKEYFLMPEQAQGAFMPAPPVESEAFKRWFGDSKVVDADGKPLVVYHGTNQRFNSFDPTKVGDNFPTSYGGFYFVSSESKARAYADETADDKGGRSRVVPVYLSIENPLVVDAPSDVMPEIFLDDNVREILARATDGDHDGVIVNGTDVYGDGSPVSIYLAFTPTQIKSTKNKGTFDPANPDIRYSPGTKVTETPEFKKWFGDSKVVDEQGNPLRVYHGTKRDFTEFNPKAKTATRGGDGLREHGVRAMFFTDSTELASAYAGAQWSDLVPGETSGDLGYSKGGNIVPSYLKIDHPYTIDAGQSLYDKIEPEIHAFVKGGLWRGKYDGIIVKNLADTPGHGGSWRAFTHTAYVVFEPTQIKSAIGNLGTFDPNNPDIRYMPEKGKINWSTERGSVGTVPQQRELSYYGFTRPMTPAEFRALVPPGVSGSRTKPFVLEQIKDGKPIGPPFLAARWNEDTKSWKVTSHEGRSRADAAAEVAPEAPMPVSVLLDGGLRARDLTPEMRKAPFEAQRYMPNQKPLKGSLGKGSIKFFHYSDTPNKGKIDPKYFGRSGLTGGREQAGLPRAFAYAEGSTLGQDAGLVDARQHYYEGEAPKAQIYDGVEDALDYGAEPNRAKADQKLIDKGFIGIYREGVDGRKQIEFFQPMSVVEAEKPETPPALAEEAVPILEPLALEEIDYAAQDREFARRKEAGEPLYMPKARGITSQLEATLQAIPEKASRQQIEAALRDGVKERGQLIERPVKAEEMRDVVDQTGRSFEEFLKENPQASKQELLDFVRQNQIQVLEERLGRFGKAAEHTEEEWVRMSEEWEEAGKRAQERGDTEAANRFFTRSEQAARYAEGLDDAGSTAGTPKFERYTLPGGERYREILYTTPEQGPTFTREDLTHDTEGMSPREQALYWVIKGPDNTYIISKKEYKTLDAAMEHVVRTKQPHSTGFKSQHFENVPNYLAHARVNERVVPYTPERIAAIGQKLAAGMKVKSVDSLGSGAPEVGVTRGYITEAEAIAFSKAKGFRNEYHDSIQPEGETMLFAEEIQSDLHQKARTEGYREALTPDEENALLEQQMALNREYAAAVKADNVPEMERLEAEKQALRDRFKRAKSGIPDAPFKKSWHEFVFKNLLRDAVEQGKDWLGWTTGDQQAARYDLSKQIAKVQVMPSTTEGRERLWAYDHAGKMVLNQQIDAGTADQYVGKEVAKKLYEAPEQTFRDALMDEDKSYREVSGIDLKVGGEGMRGFYDEILPRFVDKYLKKYGIKTEAVSLDNQIPVETIRTGDGKWRAWKEGDGPTGPKFETNDEAKRWGATNLGAGGYVHAVRITPELRKDVLEKGQPAYMPAKVTETPEWWGETSDNPFARGMTKGEEQLDWLRRHQIRRSGDNFLFYHATSKRTAAIIRSNGLRAGSYLATNPDTARRMVEQFNPRVKNSEIEILEIPLKPWDFEPGTHPTLRETFKFPANTDVRHMSDIVKPFTPDAAAAFMPVPRVDLEDYIGRDVVTLTTDRLDIGTKDVGPVGARKPLAKEAQGGRGFPHVYTGLGWAFSDPGSAARFLTRLRATAEGNTALVATSVLAEPNVLNSPFGQHAVAAAFRHAVEAGALKEKDVDRSIKTIFSRAAKSAGGDKAFARIKSLADYEREAADWGFSFGATREAVQRLDAAELKIPAEVRRELGLDILSLARSISDPELAGLPVFSLVSMMEIPLDQKPVKDDIHHSYPYTVKGKLLGFMKSPYRAEPLISTPRVRNRQGTITTQPMMTVMPSLDILKPSELNPDPQQVLADARLEYAR